MAWVDWCLNKPTAAFSLLIPTKIGRLVMPKRILLAITLFLVPLVANSEWTHRYPKVDGQRHHIYLESYELPILSSGPKYPAPSPKGDHIAFASNGWIWIMDSKTNIARRVTNGRNVDGRPRWSPDSRLITFVRDSGEDSSIAILDVLSGETTSLDTPKIDLDPEFSPDGKSIYFSSAKSGTLNIWQYNLSKKSLTMITNLKGHSRNPRLSKDGKTLFFSHLDWPKRQVRSLNMASGKESIIKTDSIAGQFSFDVHPTRELITYNWAVGDDLNLTLADLNNQDSVTNLTPGRHYVQDPAWSGDGKTIYYSEPDHYQQFKLMSVSSKGGAPKEIEIDHWDWQQKTSKVKVKTLIDGKIAAARLSIVDDDGHPVSNPNAATYFDSENGRHYFYSNGEIEIEVPQGDIRISAVHGMMGIPVETKLSAADKSEIEINLSEIWNAHEAGYHSSDFHLHLNYDGPFRHVTSGIEPLVAGENLDIATPQAANLHNRLMDREFLGETVQSSSGALIKFSQEVRSHFHGHIGVVGPNEFYFPWFWGPGYPKLNNGNLSNASVFEFVNSFEASIGTYVHPVAYNIDPFNYKRASSIPLEFIPDSILSKEVGLELVCAWSDELGTTELWYRLLNIGRPVIAMAGTDMFVDFHRTPAIGTARVFAQQKQDSVQWAPFIKAVKEGRSFVTNTPVLLLELGEKAKPGDVIKGGEQSFSLYVTSAIPVENIELIINGEVAWAGGSIKAGASKTFNGEVKLPKGGWIAARAHGGNSSWPLMDSYPFAHTSPIWINNKGSTEPKAKAKATREIKRALQHIEERAKLTYKGDDISLLLQRIELARAAIAN